MEKRLALDYPRLAKETGFNFYYRFKRVNWNKIDQLNVEEIADQRKYEQLEDCIELILNCELDEEVTKVLDKNFVKLFRLAQLSVGYLQHCMLFLDQCVVILQEKLSAAPQESEVNILSNKENGIKCEKCQKVFISVSCLESHQKRRHSTLEKVTVESASTQTEPVVEKKITTCSAAQQTDEKRVINTSSQTSQPKCFDKGIVTDVVVLEKDEEEFKGKLEQVLEKLEAIEAQKSEESIKEKPPSDDNAKILQHLENLMPLLTMVPKEKAVEEIRNNEPLLIDLNESPVKPLPEVSSILPVEEKPKRKMPRRKKIASPVEVSDEDEIIQQPVAKPRAIIKKPEPIEPEMPEPSIKTVLPPKLDLQTSIDRKLWQLGIDPDWNGLPNKSFEKAMAILQQGNKNEKLRQEIEAKIQSKLYGGNNVAKPETVKQFMYDTDTDKESESDSIVQIEETTPITIFQNEPEKPVPLTRTTDLSIFQIPTPKTPEKKDSDSDESEPIKIKSSLLIKNKDEPKKRVVFADNFILETTHNNLLNLDNNSTSSSNSWDLP